MDGRAPDRRAARRGSYLITQTDRAEMDNPETRSIRLLSFLYGEEVGASTWSALARRLAAFRVGRPRRVVPAVPLAAGPFTERDTILITYGDQFREPGRPPLQTLKAFLDDHLRDAISGVHLLPCFPYSSDDGFSVIDYRQIDPALGDWDDVAALSSRYRLMLDFVANHISRQSAWFTAFRRDELPHSDYFLTVQQGADLSQVVRPRAQPLLTPVEGAGGMRDVWTTFSADQIDLNYANPGVLLEMTDILLDYVAHGADIIRLDAIAYLWKTIGTSCIHLPQTHAIVKLWRAVLDAVAPDVLIITETNVPHADNIGYFGAPLADGGRTDEAQMVYNFSLAPLTLHALRTGDATALSGWAARLKTPSAGATFFNFIASHDGIGVLPARGVLDEAQMQGLVDRTLAHGGQVSDKANPDGSTSVYELNIALYDFLNDPTQPEPERDIQRFLASQAILLSMAGVPGIYVHSLFGSRNCHACFEETGRPRSLNRRKFDCAMLEADLVNPVGHTSRVFKNYRHMLRVRRDEPAFHPAAEQQVLDLGPAVFAVLRTPSGTGNPALCLVNVSAKPQKVGLDIRGGNVRGGATWRDLIAGATYAPAGGPTPIELAAYQACWLIPLFTSK